MPSFWLLSPQGDAGRRKRVDQAGKGVGEVVGDEDDVLRRMMLQPVACCPLVAHLHCRKAVSTSCKRCSDSAPLSRLPGGVHCPILTVAFLTAHWSRGVSGRGRRAGGGRNGVGRCWNGAEDVMGWHRGGWISPGRGWDRWCQQDRYPIPLSGPNPTVWVHVSLHQDPVDAPQCHRGLRELLIPDPEETAAQS